MTKSEYMDCDLDDVPEESSSAINSSWNVQESQLWIDCNIKDGKRKLPATESDELGATMGLKSPGHRKPVQS
jgi:hypothetical protein